MALSYFEIVPAMQQFVDGNGNPLSGGKLYTYTAGTTSNKTTWREVDGITANANPIILDSNGNCPYGVYGTTGAYKLRLDTSADVTVRTRDNVTGIGDFTASGWRLLSSQTASASTTIDFTQFSSSYNVYRIEIYGVVPGTDNTDLWMRVSTNAGVSYDSGASDYQHARGVTSTAGTESYAGSAADTKMVIALGLGSSTGENLRAAVDISGIATSVYKTARWQGAYYTSTPTFVNLDGSGMRVTTSAINAVRFLMSSGTISSGTFKLFALAE
jgi:hypothetical protein